MLIGVYENPTKKIPEDVINVPNFWHQDYYKYICHNDYFIVPDWDKCFSSSDWHKRIILGSVLDGVPAMLEKDLSRLTVKSDLKIIAFNEIFKSDAGLFSTALRQNLTPDKIETILRVLNHYCPKNEISITEHRLGSLFVSRQSWFIDILKKCDRYLDAVGLQLWIQPSSNLYTFQKEVSFYLINKIQDLGFPVFISECAIFEKDWQKQADILEELLQKLKQQEVTRFSYWYLKDRPKMRQPGRDCSLGPGLFDEIWNPKPSWEVIKKYAKSF